MPSSARISSVVRGREEGRIGGAVFGGPYTLKQAVKCCSSFSDLFSPKSKIKAFANCEYSTRKGLLDGLVLKWALKVQLSLID